ncbi:MAG: nickel-dependent lactate racemase [Candidatus Latescibacterota bacterium]|nr:nickel-dependent lactate racemase [Candidatus Latescibacterota bacterium]
MNEIKVAYGKGSVGLDADPDVASWTSIRPKFEPAFPDPESGFRAAVANPIVADPLDSLVKPTDKVVIATSDGTRPVPNHLLITWLLDALPVPAENVTVLLGTGTHRPNTQEEIVSMFGVDVVRRVNIVNHDAFDSDTNINLGRISTGTEAYLDHAYVEADKRIVVGFIEPHFFAGYSGGAKGVAPGVAGIDTILRLHRAELIGHKKSKWGVMDGNPIQNEISEIVGMCPPDFMVNVTLNGDKDISGFYLGDYIEAHKVGRAAAKETAMQAVEKAFPVVVTSNSGFPLDQNLYQTVKGISAAARIVSDGGHILVASECSDGVPNHGNFAEIMKEGNTPSDVLASIGALDKPILDQWQAQILAGILERAKIRLLSDMDRSEIEACKLESIDDLNAGVRDSLGVSNEARVAVLPDGPLTIPYIEGTT